MLPGFRRLWSLEWAAGPPVGAGLSSGTDPGVRYSRATSSSGGHAVSSGVSSRPAVRRRRPMLARLVSTVKGTDNSMPASTGIIHQMKDGAIVTKRHPTQARDTRARYDVVAPLPSLPRDRHAPARPSRHCGPTAHTARSWSETASSWERAACSSAARKSRSVTTSKAPPNATRSARSLSANQAPSSFGSSSKRRGHPDQCGHLGVSVFRPDREQ